MGTEDVFFGSENEEFLTCNEFDEAVEKIIDDYYPGPVPKEIKVVKYARVNIKPSDRIKRIIFESVIEILDEDYSGPDYLEQSKEVLGKIEIEVYGMLERICKIYVSWDCEEVGHVMINTKSWVIANAPELISNGIIFEEDETEENK